MFLLIQGLDPIKTDRCQLLIGKSASLYCILNICDLFFNHKLFLILDDTVDIQTGKLSVDIRYQLLVMISQPFFPRRGSHFIIEEATGCYTQQEDKGSNNNLLFLVISFSSNDCNNFVYLKCNLNKTEKSAVS